MQYRKNLKHEKKPGSMVVIEGSVSYDEIKPFRDRAHKEIHSQFEIDGFRKGKVPAEVFAKHVSEFLVLNEGAEIFFREEYPEMIRSLAIHPVDSPKIEIKKIATDNPLEFMITVAVMPELTLPDYKKIASGVPKSDASQNVATPEEITKTIEELAKMVLPKDTIFTEDQLTPDFIKKFGDFATADDFKKHVSEAIAKDKERKAKDLRRGSIVEKILESFTPELPDAFIDEEIERMFSELDRDLTRLKINRAQYLADIKKTEDDLRKEWRDRAISRVRSDLALTEISRKENIAPKPEDIEHEVNHILHHDKNIDKERVRMYVDHVLTLEATITYLEGLAK